ncbi:hypothetical protein DFP93_11126 [Aneurinibacillus soli]|nr:hypothetical protein DFP93_11126 [Aneurinibacillus soli]
MYYVFGLRKWSNFTLLQKNMTVELNDRYRWDRCVK